MKANYESQKAEAKAAGSLNLSLYDLNKQVIAQLPDLTPEEIELKAGLIFEYVAKHGNYYMLLGRDINYYTLFVRKETTAELPIIESEVIECLKYLGSIKAIDLNEDGTALELWVVLENNEAMMLLFFDYTEGVIVCQ